MTRVAAVVLLFCAATVGQCTGPTSGSEIPQRKEILKNNRVTVKRVMIAPSEGTAVHKHALDFVEVFVSGGHTQVTIEGRSPSKDKTDAGDVRFQSAGITHSIKNVGSEPFVSVMVEFADAQGRLKNVEKKSQTCTPDKEACVMENELFCTDKVCVEDVVMAPHSVTVKHSHSTDHMLIAVSDYELTDEVEGKGTVVRTHKSGEVEYIPAGITHRLTNTGKDPAHFAVILWK